MNLENMKHDFKGNIRNQTILSEDLFRFLEEGKALDQELLDDIIEIKTRMDKLWSKMYECCKKQFEN